MNIKRILVASSLCAVLLSTGCSGAPVTRSMAANDTAARTNVTRSFDGYRSHNNHRTRNRFGSPLGRGYNVRTNATESNLRVGDNLTPSYSRNSNLNTPRRSHAAITQTRTETKSHETKKQAPGSAAKIRATEATEKLHRSSAEARKNAEQQISRTRAANESKAKETKHTPQTSVRATPHRATPRHTYSNVERGIVRTRNTTNEVLVDGHGLNNHVMPSPYRARQTENRSFLRGYRYGNGHIRRNAGNARAESQGYVLNYNNGYDGVIRDYRFGDHLGYGHNGYRHSGYRHSDYGHNYGHNYARRSHAYHPRHYGNSPVRSFTNTFTRGTNALRSGNYRSGLFRTNNLNRGYTRNHYQSPMFGYGYNYESNIVNHPYGYGAGTAGHFNGQIVNVPYSPGVMAGT